LAADRALVAGLANSAEELLAIERLAAHVLLHDEREDVLDALVGREAARALLAFAPPPRDVTRGAEPRVDHLALEVGAERTLHSKRESTNEQFVPPKPNELFTT